MCSCWMEPQSATPVTPRARDFKGRERPGQTLLPKFFEVCEFST